jgi:uncharacterized protein YndB with AHSA1/START domain
MFDCTSRIRSRIPGFRPAPTLVAKENAQLEFFFTAMITLAAHNSGTRYSATVIHADEAGRKKHAAMEFKEGWGKALDQLVALAQKK